MGGDTVGVVGGGVMGGDIALLALLHGCKVHLVENHAAAAEAVGKQIAAQLAKRVEKGKMNDDEQAACLERLHITDSLGNLGKLGDDEGCNLIIEAVIEELAGKQAIFTALEDVVAPDCLLASNTSTLSITAIAAALKNPSRLVGMHFFNPAPVMRLVEVVSGLETAAAVAEQAAQWATRWGKQVVHCASHPGFIVNRVARPFYCEPLALLESGCAAVDDIDAVISGSGVFPMGAFELMDLIGVDTNYRNTLSLYNAYHQEARFRPSFLQQEYINSGRRGRKSGKGFYDYSSESPRLPQRQPALHNATSIPAQIIYDAGSDMAKHLAQRCSLPMQAGDTAAAAAATAKAAVVIDGMPLFFSDGGLLAEKRHQCGMPCIMADWIVHEKAHTLALCASDDCSAADKARCAGFFNACGMQVLFINDTPGMIVHRLLCLLINESLFAITQNVCSDADCDLALSTGMNLSVPPLALAQQLGYAVIHDSLRRLQMQSGDIKFRPAPALQQRLWRQRP